MGRINLKSLDADGLNAFAEGLGLPPYRAAQLAHWMYDRRASSVDEITEFSKPLRAKLNEVAYIGGITTLKRLSSSDGTEKFQFALEDGLLIESVLIPDGRRLTLCISSQAGCAMGCKFCLTGKRGFKRNLSAFEIAEQVVEAGRQAHPRAITNIVLMGMGEPLKNLDAVSAAIKSLTGFLHFSGKRITVSTSGLVSEMRELSRRAPYVNLAVSLNAATDAERDILMPVNKKYPIKALIDACRKYPLPPRSRITFEYVLIDGVNDSASDARRVVALLKGIPSKVNLIPMNEFEGCGLKRSPEGRVLAFQKILTDAGLTAIIRKSKGRDISAACGQLGGGVYDPFFINK